MGIAIVSVIQSRIPLHRAFVIAVLGAGAAIIVGGAMATLTPAVIAVFVLGLCGGGVYVLGYTILQTDVDDQLRGRIFAVLYTVVRFCLLLAFAIAPVLSSLLDKASNALVGRAISVAGVHIALPGVRLTLWFGGSIIIGAGLLAVLALRSPDSAAADA
jgi:dTMP kinase